MNKLKYAFLGCLLGMSISTAATAQEFSYKGFILSDLRLTVGGQDRPDDVDPVAFDRIDNSVGFTGSFMWNDVDAVADITLTYSGKSEVSMLDTLKQRAKVDPFYIESESLYIRVSNFIVDGLDLRLGRQIVDWGTADRFNPTNVVNGLDLEDYQDFGRRVANEMVSLTYTPDWDVYKDGRTIFGDFHVQFVWVPKFRSALLPTSMDYAFSEPNEFRRYVKSDTLNNLIDLQEKFLEYDGTVNYNVHVNEPDFNIDNSQVGLRLGFTLLGVDIDFMGYYGYDHIVQPKDVVVTATAARQDVQNAIDKNIHFVTGNESERAGLMKLMDDFGYDGISTKDGGGVTATAEVDVVYPRVFVVGADFATSLDFLGGVGLWGEVAFTFHDDIPININIKGNDEKGIPDTIINEIQVKDGWFPKIVIGVDNTFTSWFYMNMQYIYGFTDEFGDNDIEHYLMVNTDFKMVQEQILLRLSLVMNLQDPSAIFMPSFTFGFWQGLSLVAGGLFHFGDDDSKFGNRTTGPNYVFLQAKYSF